ncbi:Cysteine proteinase [Diplonema papillatum]|nr:Cysteine proteinase [Diplonema papillatum]
MRTLCFALLAFAASTSALPASYVTANHDLLWKSFKSTYNKKYTAAEESIRKAVHLMNMLEAAELEKRNPMAQFGNSPFADLTKEEFKVYHSLQIPMTKKAPVAPMFTAEEVAAADPVDWRTKGAVTQVKNQGQCGSCWSFSTTGNTEGQWQIAGNTLTSLSEQMFVSCDTVDQGCNGGLMDSAWGWVISAHEGKMVTEAAYPYTSGEGVTGTCKWSASMAVGATVKGHTDIAHNEEQMATWVSTHGPLSIAVDASAGWQNYQGGILSTCFGRSIDHGVLIVGYTNDYWIVKNSWGPSWGESGYIRLLFGTNQCDITSTPCSATV